MEILGLQPLVASSAKSTATGKKIDEGRNLYALQAWIRALFVGLRESILMAAEWHRGELPEDTEVEVYSDFEVPMIGDADATLLLKATQAGKLTNETFLAELQRRGKLSEKVDVVVEAETLKEQEPKLEDFLSDGNAESEDD